MGWSSPHHSEIATSEGISKFRTAAWPQCGIPAKQNSQLYSTSQLVMLEGFPLYFSKEYFSNAHLEIVFQVRDFTQESSVYVIL